MEVTQKFNFSDTTSTRKIFELKKRIRAVAGGTSASKTISILVWIIDYCQSELSGNQICSVVSESFPHLSGGAIRDFEAIMKDRNYWKDDNWNKTNHTYKFETGNILEFLSVDTYGKAHGPRRDILFINEANNIPYNIADQLISRTRKVIWMDWNPSDEFWFYTELLNKRDDIDFITLTYLDNEALDEITIKEIESHKDNKNWWQVYGLGQLGVREETIYSGWQIIDEIPYEARLERRGLDFGYSNDPTAIVDIFHYNGGFILDELCYQKGLSNKSIADVLTANGFKHILTIADSAEPKSIDEIKGYGVNIIGAVKGKDSVCQGIQFVQNQKISVTKRSLNIIKSYRNYSWLRDKKTNIILNTPDDTIHEWSNSMDAIRYGLDSYRPADTDFERIMRRNEQNYIVNPYI
jgi:phage terminase large subunit